MEVHNFHFKDGDKEGVYKAFFGNDVEFVNPIIYYSDWFKRCYISREMSFFSKEPPMGKVILDALTTVFGEKANLEWNATYQEIEQTQIPQNFLELLVASRKKRQTQLMRGQCLTSWQFIAFVFKAWLDYEFSFSKYTFEQFHPGLNADELPKFFSTENGVVIKVGKTNLSDGQLKQAIEQRRVIIAKFLDNDKEWHCFFSTYNSLKGLENWKEGGQPHLHYISSKFGLSREEVVKRMKSDHYASTGVHIDLVDYNNGENSNVK